MAAVDVIVCRCFVFSFIFGLFIENINDHKTIEKIVTLRAAAAAAAGTAATAMINSKRIVIDKVNKSPKQAQKLTGHHLSHSNRSPSPPPFILRVLSECTLRARFMIRNAKSNKTKQNIKMKKTN